MLAWDPHAEGGTGKLVVVESKWRAVSEGGNSRVGVGVLDPGARGTRRQLSEEWVRGSWEAKTRPLPDNTDVGSAIKEKYGTDTVDDAIDEAIDAGPRQGYRRELFVARDSRDGRTIAKGKPGAHDTLADFASRAHYYKTGEDE
jgi:hypothetical protein